MAAHAILEVTNAFFHVLGLDSGRGVLMAAIAGVYLQAVGVARAACADAAFAVIEWKHVAKVEARRRPGAGGVARLAVRAEGAPVVNGIGMAAHACLRRTFEDIVGMTFRTGRVDVGAGQGKGRLAVIECCVRPLFRCMATGAVGAELSLMLVVLAVTGDTILRRALVHLIHVTGFALRGRVLAE